MGRLPKYLLSLSTTKFEDAIGPLQISTCIESFKLCLKFYWVECVRGENTVTVSYCFKSAMVQARHRQTSNIWRTLVGNKIVDHSDVVGAPPVGVAPTTSSFMT